MALIANSADDRVEQILIVTERLTALIEEETRRIANRQPPLAGAEGDEKNRLVNAYRLEMTRIGHDRTLIEGAPSPKLARLRAQTALLHERLALHEEALGAIKLITEGLVQAMAEEVVRQRGGGAGYGATGAFEMQKAPQPALVDRSV